MSLYERLEALKQSKEEAQAAVETARKKQELEEQGKEEGHSRELLDLSIKAEELFKPLLDDVRAAWLNDSGRIETVTLDNSVEVRLVWDEFKGQILYDGDLIRRSISIELDPNNNIKVSGGGVYYKAQEISLNNENWRDEVGNDIIDFLDEGRTSEIYDDPPDHFQ